MPVNIRKTRWELLPIVFLAFATLVPNAVAVTSGLPDGRVYERVSIESGVLHI